VGHHRRRLLVAHVDQADAEPLGVHRQDDVGSAHDIEDSIDTLLLKALSNELAAIHLRHTHLLNKRLAISFQQK
jgi:hypothetical protein